MLIFLPFFIQEGIIHDELIIAPPTATKRHKRALHTETHTIWKKAQEVLNFEDDELFGNYVFLLYLGELHNGLSLSEQLSNWANSCLLHKPFATTECSDKHVYHADSTESLLLSHIVCERSNETAESAGYTCLSEH